MIEWHQLAVLLLNPLAVAALFFVIAFRARPTKAGWWDFVLRLGYALCACGLSIHWGIEYLEHFGDGTFAYDPPYEMTVLTDIGIFIGIMARVGELVQFNLFRRCPFSRACHAGKVPWCPHLKNRQKHLYCGSEGSSRQV